jgi:tRNA(fMet)-specific endonuclease VapC
LVQQNYEFVISSVSKYEIYSGATQGQLIFWDTIFQTITILPFDEACMDTAVSINKNLKRKRKQIDIADLFIAATALTHKLPIATLNRNHFDRVDELQILD